MDTVMISHGIGNMVKLILIQLGQSSHAELVLEVKVGSICFCYDIRAYSVLMLSYLQMAGSAKHHAIEFSFGMKGMHQDLISARNMAKYSL